MAAAQSALEVCAQIKDEAARLKCFDAAAMTKVTAKPAKRPVSGNEALVAKARAAIAKRMKDPDSTRVQNVVQKGDILCGTFNAKNGYGGYGRREMFVYSLPKDKVYLLLAEEDDFGEGHAIWRARGCEYRED
jgi:hypothetical protein